VNVLNTFYGYNEAGRVVTEIRFTPGVSEVNNQKNSEISTETKLTKKTGCGCGGCRGF
jgi:hypothetical protein